MSSRQERFRVAVLDDFQNVALSLADWSVLDARATVTVFNDHLGDSDAVVERLQPFDIVCVMRERTPMTRTIIERLPKLRLIASTATRNASIDLKTAEERGIQVVHTGYTSAPTIELTWALIPGSARNLVAENASLRSGGWQQSVGDDMAGRTLGVLGLGNIGGAVARIGNAFGMKVIAWSQNLTTERAAEVGAALVSKDALFREADVVSIHVVLSGRTRGLVGAAELALMKPTARLVNTSRGPIVVEADLIAALKDKTIAGAAIDVFDQERLPLDHPFGALPNLLATPHIGYVSRGLYARFYQDTVTNICRWLDGQAAEEPVKIHSYLSPADGLQVNTQMIEGPHAVVIFDGQLLLPYADEVASYVQMLGKPVDRIILSHAHTDHWGGLQVLTERFPDARVFALDGVADQVRARGPARLDGLRRTYGDKAATKVTVPKETITEGLQRIDGVTYDFKRFVDAESDLQLAALLPEQKVLMAFDLVFSPNRHAFTGANHFDHWMIVLESLKALQGYDTITIGHDTPVDRAAIDSTITYVKRAKQIHAAAADAKTYSENLKAAFPDLQQGGFVDLSASYLYAAPG